MDCKEAMLLISMGIDGELKGGDTERMLAHVRECPACAEYRKDCQMLDDLMATVRRPQPSGDAAGHGPH
jgi:anti-sigma factor RsiW